MDDRWHEVIGRFNDLCDADRHFRDCFMGWLVHAHPDLVDQVLSDMVAAEARRATPAEAPREGSREITDDDFIVRHS